MSAIVHDQGHNHVFEVGGPISWSRLLYRTKYGCIYPVSWTAVCYNGNHTLHQKVGVVRPNFGGSGPPTPGVAPLIMTFSCCKRIECPVLSASCACWQHVWYIYDEKLKTMLTSERGGESIVCFGGPKLPYDRCLLVLSDFDSHVGYRPISCVTSSHSIALLQFCFCKLKASCRFQVGLRKNSVQRACTCS